MREILAECWLLRGEDEVEGLLGVEAAEGEAGFGVVNFDAGLLHDFEEGIGKSFAVRFPIEAGFLDCFA